jgi:hypothetical protein
LVLVVLVRLLELALLVEQTVEILYLVLLLQLAVVMAVGAISLRLMEGRVAARLMPRVLVLEKA